MFLNDTEGKNRVWLALNEKQKGFLSLSNEAGSEVTTLGEHALLLHMPDGKNGFVLGVDMKEMGLGFIKDGKGRASLGVAGDTTEFQLNAGAGGTSTRLAVRPAGEISGLVVTDANGTVQAGLGIDAYGKGLRVPR
jgi:hypothetical protein